MGEAATALRSLSPTEFAEGKSYEVDAVPTGIALRDGRLYIALFGGFPFLTGAGKVVSIPKVGGAPTPRIDVEGLNAPVTSPSTVMETCLSSNTAPTIRRKVSGRAAGGCSG